MRPFLPYVACLVGFLTAGCRYSPSKNPETVGESAPGEQFTVGAEKVENSGSVRVENVAGVPRLTVDVRGE